MNVKGIILEDDQGREFVMGCERPYTQIGQAFVLRGWQRRRLVPLRYSEQERRHIIGEALIALDDLFSHFPRDRSTQNRRHQRGVRMPFGSDAVLDEYGMRPTVRNHAKTTNERK